MHGVVGVCRVCMVWLGGCRVWLGYVLCGCGLCGVVVVCAVWLWFVWCGCGLCGVVVFVVWLKCAVWLRGWGVQCGCSVYSVFEVCAM